MADRRRTTLAATLLAAALLAAPPLHAAGFEAPNDGVYADHIDWGVIMDLTGAASAAQTLWTAGFKDYLRMVDDAGGVNGRKINALVEDDRFDPALDRIAWEKLGSQTPTLGVSGLGNANGQAALATTIRRGKLPLLGAYTTTKALTSPPTNMFYGGFCGYNEMAEVGVGAMADKLKLTAPKVAIVHLDTAGGKEYADYIAAAAKRAGGSAQPVPIKFNAADASAQVLEIVNTKPDFVAVHGTPTTAILLMRAMAQYGVKTPVFGMAYIGTPLVYNSLSAETGANYSFVSCFTPGSTDNSPGVTEMSEHADKDGHAAMKDDINYVAGWVTGQLVAEAVKAAGPDVTREKLVAMLAKGFSIDTRGLSAPIAYTPESHLGLVELKPFSYDYATKRFIGYGSYADYARFVQ